MSRPFLLLYTECSGVDQLIRLLDLHPFVNIRKPQFDKQRPRGVVVVPEARRIHVMQKIWHVYESPVRRAFGVALRIDKQEGHLRPGSEFMDVLRRYEPAVLVLRDDNMMMQALERMTEGAGGPVAIEPADLQCSLQSVRQDYRMLDDVAEQFGPVTEIARDEVHDCAEILMASFVRLLALPDKPIATPEGEIGTQPALEDLASNPAQVREIAEGTEFAGLV